MLIFKEIENYLIDLCAVLIVSLKYRTDKFSNITDKQGRLI